MPHCHGGASRLYCSEIVLSCTSPFVLLLQICVRCWRHPTPRHPRFGRRRPIAVCSLRGRVGGPEPVGKRSTSRHVTFASCQGILNGGIGWCCNASAFVRMCHCHVMSVRTTVVHMCVPRTTLSCTCFFFFFVAAVGQRRGSSGTVDLLVPASHDPRSGRSRRGYAIPKRPRLTS